jgi:hypothetical protein
MTDAYHLREIAIDLLDEILAERRSDGDEHDDAQGDALILFGDARLGDPKMVARALLIAIADRLSDNQ